MKHLAATLLLSTSLCYQTIAQSTFLTSEQRPDIVSKIMSVDIPSYDFASTKIDGLQASDSDYLENIRVLTPMQLNQVGYPTMELSDTHQIMMGTTVNQHIMLGNIKATSTYIFDLRGNVINHQFSIPIGN